VEGAVENDREFGILGDLGPPRRSCQRDLEYPSAGASREPQDIRTREPGIQLPFDPEGGEPEQLEILKRIAERAGHFSGALLEYNMGIASR
jgi:hypothetical protein